MSGRNKIIGMAKERDMLMARIDFLEHEVERLRKFEVQHYIRYGQGKFVQYETLEEGLL